MALCFQKKNSSFLRSWSQIWSDHDQQWSHRATQSTARCLCRRNVSRQAPGATMRPNNVEKLRNFWLFILRILSCTKPRLLMTAYLRHFDCVSRLIEMDSQQIYISKNSFPVLQNFIAIACDVISEQLLRISNNLAHSVLCHRRHRHPASSRSPTIWSKFSHVMVTNAPRFCSLGKWNRFTSLRKLLYFTLTIF